MRRIMRAAAVAAALGIGMHNSACADELSVSTRDGARSAILVPAPRTRAPTVIVLHGALISAEYTRSWYGFAEAAARKGFAAVFPRGTNMLWNDGRDTTWTSGADDVGFLRRLVRELVGRGTADPARIYLVGVSSGGMMTLRMLCETSEAFAGAGVIIGSMPTSVGARCRSGRPTVPDVRRRSSCSMAPPTL
jgi:polyhydroxybutyrate depolymerase